MIVVPRSMVRRHIYKSPMRNRSNRNTLDPSDSSPCHRELLSFRRYAHSKASSTVHVGASYEHLCARTLPRLDFHDLIRTGGRADKGIDLLGKWLPRSLQRAGSLPLNVVVQCKAVARKAGPEMIRELEGALAGAPGEWKGDDTVGVLCARRDVTAGVRDALRRSKRGVVWIMVEDLDDAGKEDETEDGEEVEEADVGVKEKAEARGGRIRQVLWNDRVQKLVGKDTGTGVIHIPGEAGGPMETEVLMSLNGAVLGCDHGSEIDSPDPSRL